MARPGITYVIHIATTAEQLWKALTSADVLQKNWGRIESEWTVGSPVTEVDDSGKLLWKGEVLHSDPPRLLSYTFDVIAAAKRLPKSPSNSVFPLPRSRLARRSCGWR